MNSQFKKPAFLIKSIAAGEDSMIHFFEAQAAWLRSAIKKSITLLHKHPADFWHGLLFITFWLSLATFPISYAMREIMPTVALVFLALYYRYAWHESILANLKVWWLFLCAAFMIFIGILFSPDPFVSFLHTGTGLNKGFILPFIAMECVRSRRDLQRLVWACAIACFWEGIDGIWQAATGKDFIMGYSPKSRRLTGSLGDYTVGNYIAIALIPSFGIWFILRRALNFGAAALLILALLWPAFFLCIGAASRSGIFAIASAAGLWQLFRGGWNKLWSAIIWPILIILLLYFCRTPRLEVGKVTGDGRWSLWEIAWRVFLEHPWFGAGSGRYNAAFRELKLIPSKDEITISHPHNLYLDILYAHGIIGFSFGLIFLFGFLWWGWHKIKPEIEREYRLTDSKGNIYWRLTAWFWLGYAGWLINGIFGHDFYRTWWLALAMSYLGIMIGAIVNDYLKRTK